jgi:hypothetical protein
MGIPSHASAQKPHRPHLMPSSSSPAMHFLTRVRLTIHRRLTQPPMPVAVRRTMPPIGPPVILHDLAAVTLRRIRRPIPLQPPHALQIRRHRAHHRREDPVVEPGHVDALPKYKAIAHNLDRPVSTHRQQVTPGTLVRWVRLELTVRTRQHHHLAVDVSRRHATRHPLVCKPPRTSHAGSKQNRRQRVRI